MNAIPLAYQRSFRFNRIKTVSRFAKFVCVGVLIYSIGFRSPIFNALNGLFVLLQIGLLIWHRKMTRSPGFQDHAKLNIITALASIALWVFYWKELWSTGHPTLRGVSTFLFFIVTMLWYWTLSRLFRLYERGLIFNAKNIRCFKILGLLCVMGWLLTLLIETQPRPAFPNHGPLPPGATIIHTGSSRLGFFDFDFGSGINFAPLFIGMTVVLIAWIMDEGRKIKEEQELTV